jgi:hypothetical protein
MAGGRRFPQGKNIGRKGPFLMEMKKNCRFFVKKFATFIYLPTFAALFQ